MSGTGKPGGLLSGLQNPATRKPAGTAVPWVSPEAEAAMGLAVTKAQGPTPAPEAPVKAEESRPEPERSKTFFLPYSVCERLEMQKLSERREMKHIVRQALEEYFAKHPLRQAVEEAFRG